MKTIKQKIIDYIEYDYGVNLPKLKYKILNSQLWENFTLIILCLTIFIIDILLISLLTILTLGHPFWMLLVIYIDLILVISVYHIYKNNLSTDIYIDKIKNFVKIK